MGEIMVVQVDCYNLMFTDFNIKISQQNKPFSIQDTIQFHHSLLPKGFITIDRRFEWNGASIPKLAALRVGSGKNVLHLKCSLFHDWLYVYGSALGISRRTADKIYRDCLRACGVSNYKSNLEYWSVIACGKSHYSK